MPTLPFLRRLPSADLWPLGLLSALNCRLRTFFSGSTFDFFHADLEKLFFVVDRAVSPFPLFLLFVLLLARVEFHTLCCTCTPQAAILVLACLHAR